MRDLHGVIALHGSLEDIKAALMLKQRALFFDRIHIFGYDELLKSQKQFDELPEMKQFLPCLRVEEIRFLQSRGFLTTIPASEEGEILTGKRLNPFERLLTPLLFVAMAGSYKVANDLLVRKYATHLETQELDAVAVLSDQNLEKDLEV